VRRLAGGYDEQALIYDVIDLVPCGKSIFLMFALTG
jgi:hypothetical protein